MNEQEQLELASTALKSINKISFSDGTQYYRMPNGNLVRSTPRPYELRKALKKIDKK